ncbi:hypothetical protein ACFVIY_01375 [Streptomyces sp. NPDC127166]|uniref:hypothetical protein n=1 Tax=Streptomyces sp. NPDC127166 TaxID=3345380 RepID=UPI00363C90ED
MAHLLLHGPPDGSLLLVTVLFLYGLFYAATEGILMALPGPVLPERLRTIGIALIQSGQALAYPGSSAAGGTRCRRAQFGGADRCRHRVRSIAPAGADVGGFLEQGGDRLVELLAACARCQARCSERPSSPA